MTITKTLLALGICLCRVPLVVFMNYIYRKLPDIYINKIGYLNGLLLELLKDFTKLVERTIIDQNNIGIV